MSWKKSLSELVFLTFAICSCNQDSGTDNQGGSDTGTGTDTDTDTGTGSDTEQGTDTTAPQVLFTIPAADSGDLPDSTTVSVSFTEPIDPTTLSTTSLALEDQDGNPVTGTVLAGTTGGTFSPDASLTFNETYTATVASSVTDLAGNSLLADYSWSFSIWDAPDTTGPQVLSTSPDVNATDVPISTWVSVSFNEPIDPTTLSSTSFTLVDPGGNPVIGTVVVGTTDGSFSPDTPLIFDTTYTASVTTSVTDLSGNPLLAEYSWSFSTPLRSWGTPQLLETDDSGNADDPQVAVDSAGNAFAVWSQLNSTTSNIYSRRYAVGTGWGSPEIIDTEDDQAAYYPQVAFDSTGNAMAVWAEETSIWCNHYVVGIGWGTPEPVVTGNINGWHDAPQLGVNGAGNAVVVWSLLPGWVWANYYTVDSGWGSYEIISPDNSTMAALEIPQVAIDSSGNAIAVWENNQNIYFNRYVVGAGWGTQELIETEDVGGAYYPQVALDSAGNGIAVWIQTDGMYDTVYSNRYVVGSGWGTAQPISIDNEDYVHYPQLALDSAGNGIAVWSQGFNIWSNRYVVGTGWGTAQLIETENAGNAEDPQIAVDSMGNGIAVWSQNDGSLLSIYSNRYSVGSGWGTAQLIENEITGNAHDPQIAVDEIGNGVSVWRHNDISNSDYDIWYNLYN